MPINDVLTKIISKEGHNKELTPYLLFKYAIKTDITRKYYERRLKKFFVFIEFEIVADKDIEFRCNKFAEKSKDNINWVLSQIIIFLEYQKDSCNDLGKFKFFYLVSNIIEERNNKFLIK